MTYAKLAYLVRPVKRKNRTPTPAYIYERKVDQKHTPLNLKNRSNTSVGPKTMGQHQTRTFWTSICLPPIL